MIQIASVILVFKLMCCLIRWPYLKLLTNTFWFFSQLFSCSFGQRLEREKEHHQSVRSKPLSSKWNIKIQEKPWVPTFSEPWKRVKDIQQPSRHWTKKQNAKMVRTYYGIFTHTSSFPSMAWHCYWRGKSVCPCRTLILHFGRNREALHHKS